MPEVPPVRHEGRHQRIKASAAARPAISHLSDSEMDALIKCLAGSLDKRETWYENGVDIYALDWAMDDFYKLKNSVALVLRAREQVKIDGGTWKSVRTSMTFTNTRNTPCKIIPLQLREGLAKPGVKVAPAGMWCEEFDGRVKCLNTGSEQAVVEERTPLCILLLKINPAGMYPVDMSKYDPPIDDDAERAETLRSYLDPPLGSDSSHKIKVYSETKPEVYKHKEDCIAIMLTPLHPFTLRPGETKSVETGLMIGTRDKVSYRLDTSGAMPPSLTILPEKGELTPQ